MASKQSISGLKTLGAWCRLLRLPALFTVPGDLLAGAVLAGLSPWEQPLRIPAVMCAYLFGMVLNDCWDLPRDRERNPQRPLPQGQISLRAAWTLCALLAGASIACMPGIPILMLLLLIVLYTLSKTRVPFLGLLFMALCRSAALWLGGGAAWPPGQELRAGMYLWAAWTLLLSWIGRLPPRKEPRPLLALVVFLLPLAGFMLLSGAEVQHLQAELRILAIFPAVFWIWLSAGFSRGILKGEIPPGAMMGKAMRLLIWMQATVLALNSHPAEAMGLMLLTGPMTLLARKVMVD